MKRYILALVLAATLVASCSREDALDYDKSTIVDTNTPANEFDLWLETNFLENYNIQYGYRYNDIIVDREKVLIPARYEESILLSKLIKHLVLEVYDELTGSHEFMVSYFPKLIQLVGCPSYNADGSVVLGEAEGGKTIFLYDVNTVLDVYSKKDITLLNNSYFHTMHHEFAHILHQTKLYSPEYETISSSLYVGNDCFSTYPTEESALKVGFITPYSSTNSDEDFVEILSTYITNTQEYWDSKMKIAGKTGEPILSQKLDIIRNYLLQSWDINMDELRSIILEHQTTVWDFDTTLE